MKQTHVFLALTLLWAGIAIAAEIFTYKCNNARCAYIESFGTSKVINKCPKCGKASMSRVKK
ncbi:MAG: hypothetical protein JWR15_2310 [Prosthecobacter sp.]|nr:hypothetical protein [Prosthecobacter sp.]